VNPGVIGMAIGAENGWVALRFNTHLQDEHHSARMRSEHGADSAVSQITFQNEATFGVLLFCLVQFLHSDDEALAFTILQSIVVS
jgi:hypothetical protein